MRHRIYSNIQTNEISSLIYLSDNSSVLSLPVAFPKIVRQTLLAAPVEARQALVRFIYRHLDKIEAQRFCQLQAFQPALPGGERFFIDAKRDLL